MTIRNIALHHTGGIGNDKYASSAHLDAVKVSAAHQDRWNFPSQHMKRPNGRPWYGGYNVIYDPKDRSFTQFRAIGEETAAQYGHNFDTFSLCIVGNFMQMPDDEVVDPVTRQIEEDVVRFLFDLINGNKRGLVVAPNTIVNLSITRVNPHRFYQSTECYGNQMGDTHFRDLLVKYKEPVATPVTTMPLEQRNAAIQALLQTYLKLLDAFKKLQQERSNFSSHERACTGTL